MMMMFKGRFTHIDLSADMSVRLVGRQIGVSERALTLNYPTPDSCFPRRKPANPGFPGKWPLNGVCVVCARDDCVRYSARNERIYAAGLTNSRSEPI